MKVTKLLLTLLAFSIISLSLSAQTGDQSKDNNGLKTESFKVYGACGMCKDRIEKTVKAEGATSASWDSKTLMLTVTYEASKTNKDNLSKKLASVGHDTEKYKAPDDVYAKLPGCCHYTRAK